MNPYSKPTQPWARITEFISNTPRQSVIALILISALLAFEAFNFDTTKYALTDLLGDTSFASVSWAAILAFAFCAIDFAGLVKIFTPEQGADEPKEVWYLMGAWLLGATMNAMMTWYAVSLIIAERMLSSSVLTQEQMLMYAPIFVAVLVWLTRILFIGSLSVAGEQIFHGHRSRNGANRRKAKARPKTKQPAHASTFRPNRAVANNARPRPQQTHLEPMRAASSSYGNNPAREPMRAASSNSSYGDSLGHEPMRVQGGVAYQEDSYAEPSRPAARSTSRVRRRPPTVGASRPMGGMPTAPMSAKPRRS